MRYGLDETLIFLFFSISQEDRYDWFSSIQQELESGEVAHHFDDVEPYIHLKMIEIVKSRFRTGIQHLQEVLSLDDEEIIYYIRNIYDIS